MTKDYLEPVLVHFQGSTLYAQGLFDWIIFNGVVAFLETQGDYVQNAYHKLKPLYNAYAQRKFKMLQLYKIHRLY